MAALNSTEDLLDQQAEDIRKLEAENERLRALLQKARPHVKASSDAEHMMDGFGPRSRQPSDGLLAQIDAALRGDEQKVEIDPEPLSDERLREIATKLPPGTKSK